MNWDKIAPIIISSASFFVALSILLISWKLYKNADAKKMFVKNQIDCLCKMIAEMRKHTLYISHIDFESRIRTFETKIVDIKSFLNDKNKYLPLLMKDNSIYIDYSFLKRLKFIDYKDEIFLPKKIAIELNKFYTGLSYSTGAEKIDGKGNIIFLNGGLAPNETAHGLRLWENIYWANQFPYERDVKYFLNHFLTIQHMSKKWLGKYGIDLNIDDVDPVV